MSPRPILYFIQALFHSCYSIPVVSLLLSLIRISSGGFATIERAEPEVLNRSPGIDSREPIPQGCVLCSPAGRYNNPIPAWFLAPIDCLKIPALVKKKRGRATRAEYEQGGRKSHQRQKQGKDILKNPKRSYKVSLEYEVKEWKEWKGGQSGLLKGGGGGGGN